ncbi:hypothetical protein [Paenibacillus sp. IHBB 10380]|nr:hypothetical protein [Paenibacillus sp. IHBB 10380]
MKTLVASLILVISLSGVISIGQFGGTHTVQPSGSHTFEVLDHGAGHGL